MWEPYRKRKATPEEIRRRKREAARRYRRRHPGKCVERTRKWRESRRRKRAEGSILSGGAGA